MSGRQQICVAECPVEGWYGSQVTGHCEQCPIGCLNCTEQGLCNQCRGFTHNQDGQCTCALSYNAYPQFFQDTLIIETFDILWSPTLIGNMLSCS